MRDASGSVAIGKRVLCVDWMVELSGSCTVIGDAVTIDVVVFGGADRKWPVAPVSRMIGLWASFIAGVDKRVLLLLSCVL